LFVVVVVGVVSWPPPASSLNAFPGFKPADIAAGAIEPANASANATITEQAAARQLDDRGPQLHTRRA
jgi:hypothetical protein